MFRIFKQKRIAVPLATVVVLALAAGAFAYFTSTGSGTGSASVGTPSNWGVTVAAASGSTLYPGAGSQTIGYTITNGGGGHQQLALVTATVASSGGNVTQGGVAQAGCLASWFNASNTPPAGLPSDLAGGAAVTGSVTVTMTDATTTQNSCQGVSPDITISAS